MCDTQTKFWWGNPNETDRLEDLVVDGKLMMKYNSNRMEGRELDPSGPG
jgi:hypothetical protein